jgi:hypothetical protein
MKLDPFALGAQEAIKLASSHPAAPVKKSLPGPDKDDPSAPYLNTPGGRSPPSMITGRNRTAPAPGQSLQYQGVHGAVPGSLNVSSAPDSGETGACGHGDLTITKSASFLAGVDAGVAEAIYDFDA